MGKLFKTISLEQRLKDSVHNTLPNLPKGSDQGVTQLQAKKIIAKPKISSLKITPQTADRSSDILKSTLRSKGAKPTPTIQPFIPTDLTKFKAPLSNLKFRSSINLSNRLTQPFLGTTAHLAQYFLSDVNTNYIKIKPFTVFDHTSNIIIPAFIYKPIQGEVNPTTSLPTTSLVQGEAILNKPKEVLQKGLVLANNVLSSTTIITIAAQDVLQKSFIFKGGVFTSTTKLSEPLQEVTQGEGTNPTISTSTPFIEKLQGIALINNKVVSLTVVSKATANVKQGEVQIANRQSDPVTNINEIVVPFTSHIRHLMSPVDTNDGPGVISWGNNKITGLKKSIRTEVALLDHQKVNAPQVNTFFDPLAFSFNKEFATVYHGDIDKLTNYYPQDNSIWSIKARAVAPLLLLGDGTTTVILGDYLKTPTTWDYSKIPANGTATYYGTTTDLPKYAGVELIKNIGNTVAQPNPNNAVLEAMTGTDTLLTYITNNTTGTLKSNGAATSGPQPKSAIYKTKTYAEITTAAKSAISTQSTKVQGMYSTTGNLKVGLSGVGDFITLKIASKTGGGTETFTSYLTSFSDSFAPTWNDITYIGRQDTLKSFKGVARLGNIGFKVVAMNADELKQLYKKLTNLAKIVAVGGGGGGNYIIGPLCAITVGNWFKNSPCVFDSLKYDIDLAETSWDIDYKMPQLVSVTMGFTLLGDTNGAPMDSKTNAYFGI